MSSVSSIDLPSSFDVYKDAEGNLLKSLEPISRVNIFVGANNSGKSRFMRLLSAQAEYQARLSTIDLNPINQQIDAIFEQLRNALSKNGLRSANGFDAQTIDALLPLPVSLNLKIDSYRNLRDAFTKWSKFGEISQWSSLSGSGLGHVSEENKTNFGKTIREKSVEALRILEQVPIHSERAMPQRVYIPVLRGLRPIDTAHNDFYAERTKSDYFASDATSNSSPEIFTGLSLYKQLTDMLLGNNSERKIISDYQSFLSKTFFENSPIALIPNPRTNAVVVKIGNEKEQPIYHLGDGIQSAIILSFLPCVMNQSAFFFIEEPEMYLHPGLQRKVLSLFASLPQHTFFLTTHSNHFLDLTIDFKDVSVFTFRKTAFDNDGSDELIPNFVVEPVDGGCNSSLELLGVKNSSVFLVNATVWVEGITDRWYFRAMLNSYMQHLSAHGSLTMRLEEDVHYSFVEYAGANITHWSFLDYEEKPIEVARLCAKALVVIDKDGDAKLQRKEQLAEFLGDRLVILPSREVENLLPFSVIGKVIQDYEGPSGSSLPEPDYDSYKDEYLGRFIEDKVLERNFSRKGGYQTDSGTLKSKVDFCEKALLHIRYSELPETSQAIVRKIYEFIRTQNV